MTTHEDCPLEEEVARQHAGWTEDYRQLVAVCRELEDARLMVKAMSKYRFAMFPSWPDEEEGLSSRAWCVAGHTCEGDGRGVPVLSDEARRGLKDLLMDDVPGHPKPGFWRRVFMRLAR